MYNYNRPNRHIRGTTDESTISYLFDCYNNHGCYNNGCQPQLTTIGYNLTPLQPIPPW